MSNYNQDVENIDPTVRSIAIGVGASSDLVDNVLSVIQGEAQVPTASAVDNLNSVTAGTDVVFFEPKDGTVIDLSLLSKDVLGDLNAVLVNSQTSVNITVPTDFNGTVISGGGDDLIVFKPRQTTGTTDSGSGNDTVKTSTGSDSVNSGGGNDSVASGQGTDSVNGGQGDDSIKTGSGSDTVTSGTGHDTVRTGAGSDSVNMGSGDSVKMGGGRDTATYTDDNTQVTKAFVDGGAGRDTLRLEGVSIEKVEQSNNKLNITLSDKSLLVVSNVELFGYDFNNDGSIGNDEIIDLVGFVGHNFGS